LLQLLKIVIATYRQINKTQSWTLALVRVYSYIFDN